MSATLTLPESLILLALNDDTGVREGQYVNYAVAGAGLAELATRRILQETGVPDNRFVIAQSNSTGDAFLDGCMAVIREGGQNKPPRKLINEIAGRKDLIQHLLNGLIDRGILRSRKEKFLFFFERTVYPEVESGPEQALKNRLAQIMFQDGQVSPDETVLIALAKQTGLLKYNFDRDLLKTHKTRIDEIANGKMLATTATAETISAIQTAIMIAVIVPVVIS